MATEIKFRGGTESENNSFTGALREITVDTTNKTIRVHDGVSQGGTAVLNELDIVETAEDGKLYDSVKVQELHDTQAGLITTMSSNLTSINYIRADKYLATQNIAAMLYTSGNLTKIQYIAATDVNYEILSYTLGNLTNIAHYVSSVLKGNTVLTYTSGALTSAVFTGV